MKRATLLACVVLMICAFVLMSFTAPASANISPLPVILPPLPTALMAEPVIGHPDYEIYFPILMTEPDATK